MSFRSARYAALAIFAGMVEVAILAACVLGIIVFGVGGLGFGSGLFLMLAALCAGCGIFAVFVGYRLVFPLIRLCVNEARGLSNT